MSLSASIAETQRAKALALLRRQGMTRLVELRDAGVTAATMARLARSGEVIRLARGLYQLADATLHVHQSLAQAAKLVPNGVICLVSALAFHGLTDQMPSRVWIAIGQKAWRPRTGYPALRIARFSAAQLALGVERHSVEGVSVPVFGVAKTLADLFRYRREVGDSIVIEGLRQALRQKKATPAEIARFALEAGIWKSMEPYMTALTGGA